MSFDRALPYATIHGDVDGRAFIQGGTYYRADGSAWSAPSGIDDLYVEARSHSGKGAVPALVNLSELGTSAAVTTEAAARAAADALLIPLAQKGAVSGVADLDSGGKIPTSRMPNLAIVDYLGTAANQSAMLALTGQKGDWCARTDNGKVYIITGSDPTQVGSWTALSYPASAGAALTNTDGDPGTTAYVGTVAPDSPQDGDTWTDPSDYGDGVTEAVVVAALGFTPVDPANLGDVVSHDASEFATAAQGATADTAVQPGDLPTAPAQTNQTGSRALNTTYTNSGSRPIMVNATVRCVTTLLGGSGSAQGKSDGSTPPTTAASGAVGIQAGLAGEDNTFLVSFVVAAGAKYRIDSSAINGSVTLGAWWEVTL